MSFSINLIDAPCPNDNLLILSNKENISWAVEYLTASESNYLAHAAKSNINYVFFPKEHRGLIIQFLETTKEINAQREWYRLAGNDIVTTVSHYKMDAITLVNKANEDFTAEYLRGWFWEAIALPNILVNKRSQ